MNVITRRIPEDRSKCRGKNARSNTYRCRSGKNNANEVSNMCVLYSLQSCKKEKLN